MWCWCEAGLEVGQPVATLSGGCFAEYVVVPAKLCMPAGTMQKEVVALLTSGLTASIGAPTPSPPPPLPPPPVPARCPRPHCDNHAMLCSTLLVSCICVLSAEHCRIPPFLLYVLQCLLDMTASNGCYRPEPSVIVSVISTAI